MVLRFRRSVKLMPGVRLNVGKRGVSASIGGRGGSVNVGKQGVFSNVGIPGTGVSSRQRMTGGGRAPRQSKADRQDGDVEVKIVLADDGKVRIEDPDGNELPPRIVRLVKEQQGAQLHLWLEEQCDCWNQGIEGLLVLHTKTPEPTGDFVSHKFSQPGPKKSKLEKPGLLAKVFPPLRRRIERRNDEKSRQFQGELAKWKDAKQEHELREQTREQFYDAALEGQAEAVAKVLEERYQQLEWPRETIISYDIQGVDIVMVDVDLPEIEDLPTETAAVASRGLKINIKQKSEAQRRREYMVHIHGVCFRIIGETFAALPNIETVLLSAYSQRPDAQTGNVVDQYLISSRVDRNSWKEINFSGLETIDVVAALDRFELNRNMTKTGIFKPIEPIRL